MSSGKVTGFHLLVCDGKDRIMGKSVNDPLYIVVQIIVFVLEMFRKPGII